MADKTLIEWTDATWNPITGCSRVSTGCEHCYAERLAGTRMKHHASRAGLTRATEQGPVWTGAVRLNKEWLDQPLHWRKPRRIFVVAHGDLFHERVPDVWIDRIFSVMERAPQHTFIVLTKRAERMLDYCIRRANLRWELWPLPNLWLGVSVESTDQIGRLESLQATPAAIQWVSLEPLLGPVDIFPYFWFLDWVVVGGESGPGSRPMNPDWARMVRDACIDAQIPFFFKQFGDWSDDLPSPYEPEDFPSYEWHRCSGCGIDLPTRRNGCHPVPDSDWNPARCGPILTTTAYRVGKKRAGRILDGRTWGQFPATQDIGRHDDGEG